MESSEFNYKEIQDKSVHGIKWVGLTEIIIRILQFATVVFLARILSPEDFGVYGIALIFIQLVNVLFDFGFSTALIQKKEIKDIHYSTTFVIYFLSAAIFTPLFIIFSPQIAIFFNEPLISRVLQILSVIFLINAMKSIPYIIVQRKMLFKKFSILQTISIMLFSIATIGSALMGAGVWSFVIGFIVEHGSLMILLNIYVWWKPSFQFNKNIFNELVSFGSNVIGSRLVGYLILNAPGFIIGKFLGIAAVGYYNIAFNLVEFPVQRISKNVLRVMFPGFSKLQDDLDSYRELYLKASYHLQILLLPIFAGLVLIAPYIVEILYGVKWLPAVLPLQLLAAAGFFRSVWISVSLVFLSKGFPQMEFKINLWFLGVLIPCLLLASTFSLAHVAAIVSAIGGIFLIVGLYKVLKLIHMPISKYLKIYLLPGISTIVFSMIIFILNSIWLNNFSLIFNLILTIFVCVVVYFILIIMFDRSIVDKVFKFIGIKQ